MNKIVNTFLLAGDEFVPKLHLREPGFADSACGVLTKHCKIIKTFKEIYKNELGQACFVHNVAYSVSNVSSKRTVSDKVLKDRGYEIAINPKFDGYQSGLASMLYKFFDKKTGLKANVNEVLAQELQKRKVFSSLILIMCHW